MLCRKERKGKKKARDHIDDSDDGEGRPPTVLEDRFAEVVRPRDNGDEERAASAPPASPPPAPAAHAPPAADLPEVVVHDDIDQLLDPIAGLRVDSPPPQAQDIPQFVLFGEVQEPDMLAPGRAERPARGSGAASAVGSRVSSQLPPLPPSSHAASHVSGNPAGGGRRSAAGRVRDAATRIDLEHHTNDGSPARNGRSHHRRR